MAADTTATRIVDAIIEDLSGRRGLRHEWENIDDDIQKEIKNRWIDIVEEGIDLMDDGDAREQGWMHP